MKNLEMNRRKNTLDFLRAQEIRNILSSKDDDVQAEEIKVTNTASEHIRPFHPFPMEGQVRVLKDTAQLVYVLLAKKWDDSSFFVIPFSSYSQPATDMELAVKNRGGLGLRVLQVWNARSLQVETLRKGWLVGYLPQEDIDDALSLWNYRIGGVEPAKDVIARTGVPICRSDDPRLKYQEESIADFAEVDEADIAIIEREDEETSGIIFEFSPPAAFAKSPIFEGEEQFALAAADAESVVASICHVDGFDGSVEVQYVPSERMLYLRVYGADDNVSTALDGWGVLGSKAEVLGYFQNGILKAEVEKSFDGRLMLLDKEGKTYPLCESSEK